MLQMHCCMRQRGLSMHEVQIPIACTEPHAFMRNRFTLRYIHPAEEANPQAAFGTDAVRTVR